MSKMKKKKKKNFHWWKFSISYLNLIFFDRNNKACNPLQGY
jgi:hypothetical protein